MELQCKRQKQAKVARGVPVQRQETETPLLDSVDKARDLLYGV